MFNFKAPKEPKRFGYDDSTENSEPESERDNQNVGGLDDEEEEGEEFTRPSFKPDSLDSILDEEDEEEELVIESTKKKTLKKSTAKASSGKKIQKNKEAIITKKKKNFKKSGAKDSDEDQRPKRRIEEFENESNDKGPKFIKLSTSKANFDTSRLTFDQLYDEFEAQNPPEIDTNRRPPYVSRLDDDDLDKLIDWQKRKIASENKLREDPMYQFIQLVAAYTNTNIKQYITIPTGGGGSRLTLGPAGTNVVTGNSPLKQLGSPYNSPSFKRIRKEKPAADLDSAEIKKAKLEAKKAKFGKERTIWDLLEDSDYEKETENLLRRREMFDALDWVEDVQV